MSEQRTPGGQVARQVTGQRSEPIPPHQPHYRCPQLQFIGPVVLVCQGGGGNRHETYQGRYWMDR